MRRLLAAFVLMLAASPARAQDVKPADASRVYELSQVEAQPVPVNVADLRAALAAGYPPALLAAGAGGRVLLSLVVAADGAVRDARVVSSSDSAFDAPSLAAIAVLRFNPGTVRGSAVATRVEIPVQWQAPPPVAQAAHADEGVVSSAGRTQEGERVYTMTDVVAEVRTYELKDVDEQPRPLNIADFRRALERNYPPELRSAAYTGTVQVRFRVTAHGTAEAPTILRSTDRRFNQATLESVRVLRFRPAKVGGRPVAVWFELPIQWQIN
jgi:TonB family protein